MNLSSFWLVMAVMPLAVSVIGVVYAAQYRVGPLLRSLLVAAHFVAVCAIIVSYIALCFKYSKPSVWQYIGLLVFLLGSGLFWYAAYRHPTCLVPDERVGIVGVGPYRYIRHPIYSGGLLGALGLIGIAPALEMLAVWGMLFISLSVLAWFEERELTGRLGKAYEDYCHRTKRLVPGLF